MANDDAIKLITPKGRAVFPKLTEPDTKFDAAGTYTVKLALTEEEAAPLLEAIEEAKEKAAEMFKKKKPKAKKVIWQTLPPQKEEDEDGEETGYLLFNFKMKASGISKKTGKPWKMKPDLFDSKGKPLPGGIAIWSGSIIKVACEISPFVKGGKAGVTLRLNAVQVLELVGPGQRTAEHYGFGEEDGYEAPDSFKVSGEDDDSGDDYDGDDDDAGDQDGDEDPDF